ncbi:hypothetical protein LAWI1_G001210 [Lachnellula willkommii]|uniref:Endonuclease/exonuclease/phosphatase domain-containing protein n=1 Tax=Lachnellula willkommii TaxID=215461 RepID=A0A559MNE3_9HELO|nr:hypothetical protein LAWI1_G001210 [Lachnellula willkommii]
MTRKQVSQTDENHKGSRKDVSNWSRNHKSLIDIRVITHNIRYATETPFKGEERWPIRCPRLCSELVFNSTSIPETFICLQEVLHSQLVDVQTSLNGSASGEWDYIGVGRDDGKQAGEYSPIFYRPSIFHVKKWRTVWLSETPEKPSKGWDAASIRIVTVGVFVHAKTGKLVLVMSTHFDNEGAKSRKESAKVILSLISSEAKLEDFSAVLLAGDFNSSPDDGAYQVMTAPESAMEDIGVSIPKERRYGNEMTFTSFGHVDNTPARIDFIFSRKSDRLHHATYAVLENRFDDGVYSSDHRAKSSTIPNKNHSPIFDDSEFSINLPPVLPPDTQKDLLALHRRHKEFFGEDGPPETRRIHDIEQDQAAASLIEQRRISLRDGEELLSSFRLMAPCFPFVQIPQNATVPSLSKSSPFLLMAILTSASIKDPPLYHQMDHEFRRVLSSKVIVEGQKSLDFLLGLLVYIACLAIDLGLDRELPNLSNFNAIRTEGLIENDEFTKAAKRAYLGCYYLSSAYCQGFGKPNNLRYSNVMDVHGESLLDDELLAPVHSMVRLRRLNEKITELHANKQLSDDPHLDSLNAELNVQIFTSELQQWRDSTPVEISSLPYMALAERFVDISIYSYELGFLRKPYRDHLRSQENKAPVIQSHLTNCLDASKRFFEYLLSLPEASLLGFTSAQWGLMVEATLVLSRLTFLMAANRGWDSNTTRTNIPLVMYLDCLCYRFQHLSSTKTSSEDDNHPKNPDVLYVFKMLLASVKKSYERRLGNIKPESFVVQHGKAAGVAMGHCPIMDPSLSVYLNSPKDSTYGGSFDLNEIASSEYPTSTTGLPLYHDLWATMTCNWAGEI